MPKKASPGRRICYILGTIEMKHSKGSNSLPLAAVALLLLAAGCNRDGVKVYKVDSTDTVATTAPPATATSPATTPGGMPATMPPGIAVPDNSGLPKLKYVLPAGWTEKAASQMRVASFDVSESGKSADISVVPLGAMSGGDLANVSRWCGQVGQPPTDEAGLKKITESVQVGDQPANLYDLAGTSVGSGDEVRIIGAILHTDISTWYFKMMGDAALVEKNKPAFIAFLKSVEFQKQAAPSTMDLGQLPASHPAIPGVTSQVVTETATADKPTWIVPPDWKEGEPSQFVLTKFNIDGDAGAAASATVSRLDNDGGGLLPNVNRWRGQLGQSPITADDAANLPTIDTSGTKAVLADFAGTDARTGKPARMVGVVLPLNGQTWFYKLLGDPDLVGRQKDAFIKFIQSAQYPAAK